MSCVDPVVRDGANGIERVLTHEDSPRAECLQERRSFALNPKNDEVGQHPAGVQTPGGRLSDSARRLDPRHFRESLGQAPGVCVIFSETFYHPAVARPESNQARRR